MELFDVIVVGAGNGGLTAGATVAKAGYKTLVLEKNNIPGGCATSFIRGRFEFEVSLHQFCGGGVNGSKNSAQESIKKLNVNVPFHFEKMLFRSIVKGEGGYDVRLRSDFEGFLDDMEEAVPGCRESIIRLLDKIQIMTDVQELMEKKHISLKKIPQTMVSFANVASHSINDLMEECGVPKKAQSIFCSYWAYLGMPTDDLCSLHYLGLMSAFLHTPPSIPHHRSYEISLGLVKVIQDCGGELRLNHEVTRFLYNDKHEAIGVEVNGQSIYAKKIIADIFPHNVWNRSDVKHIPKNVLKLANARKFAMGFMNIYLGLDISVDELGIEDYCLFIASSPDSRQQYEERADCGIYAVTCLNKPLPDASEPGTCMIVITFPIMPEDFPKDLKPEEYKKWETEIVKRYIEDLENTLGIKISDAIEEIEVLTPVWFAHHLQTPAGCAYGYRVGGWDNIIVRTLFNDIDSRIPNLSFCGGHSIRGCGYPSAYNTGFMAAEKVIKELGGECK